MKILFCSNQARSTRLVWRHFLQELVAAGHNICVAVPTVSVDTSAQDIQRLTEIAPAPKQNTDQIHGGSLQVRTFPLLRRSKNIFQEIRSFFAIGRLIRQENPQCIFATTIKPIIYTALALRLLRKSVSAPFFVCITGLGYGFEQEQSWRYCLTKILYKCALPRAKNIFFLNKHDKEYFLQRHIIPRVHQEKCVVLKSTGIDTDHFSFTPHYPKQPTFLLMARLLKAKGIEDFATAAKMLRLRYPQARFQLLGPAEEGTGAFPLATIMDWHKDNIIEYLGNIEDVRPAIAKASIMVLPSWREGMPCAILEGMSMGRAAVVTAVPGCIDLIEDGITGLVIPPHNAHALANALEYCILNPNTVIDWGAKARKVLEKNYAAKDTVTFLRQYMDV